MLMEGDPFVLIEGMTIAGLATGATRGYIYLRWEYPHAQARARGRDRGRLRGAAIWARTSRAAAARFDLEVRLGAGAYICGEETSLLESLGRQARPGALQAAAAGDRRACSASRR